MSDKMPSRGFQGAVLKLLRAGDYQLTVTGRRELTPHYLRLSFDAGGLLTDRPLHPTMWIRMWFADGDKLHQRGYTLVDSNPEADTVDIEFALHDGVASRWAQDAAQMSCGLIARMPARRWCRRSAHRRSTPPTTSAGSRATTAPLGRRQRSSARSTRSRANRLRRKPTGWRDGQRSANIFRARQMSSSGGRRRIG
jgi:hypothetical protein